MTRRRSSLFTIIGCEAPLPITVAWAMKLTLNKFGSTTILQPSGPVKRGYDYALGFVLLAEGV